MTNKEFSEKIKAGLKIAERRMIEEKALRGEDIIVSSDGKTIERIPARQLL
jgi:leucyl aminopeptidase